MFTQHIHLTYLFTNIPSDSYFHLFKKKKNTIVGILLCQLHLFCSYFRFISVLMLQEFVLLSNGFRFGFAYQQNVL